MRITSVSENKKIEKRIAVTPEVAKKYLNLGFKISLPENYGTHLGIEDNEFKTLGVSILKNEKELINNSDLIIQLGLLSEETLSLIKENQSSMAAEQSVFADFSSMAVDQKPGCRGKLPCQIC